MQTCCSLADWPLYRGIKARDIENQFGCPSQKLESQRKEIT